jgi:predicted GNAT family N-acyltransferase
MHVKPVIGIESDSREHINKCKSLECIDVLNYSKEKEHQIGAIADNDTFGVKQNLTKQELHEVYKLRYSVYVEEFKYPQPYAGHKSKILKDQLDRSGNVFGIFKDNKAIGTVLSNYVKHSDLGYYSELYKMKELVNGSYYDSSISTKLIVRKDFRSKSVAFRLALATYIQGLKDNIQFDFIDCAQEMVSFFVRLGYQVYQKNMYHPEFGPGAVLVLKLQNIVHLDKCNSPFAKYYRKIMYKENTEVFAV